jgi:hypothetical protein
MGHSVVLFCVGGYSMDEACACKCDGSFERVFIGSERRAAEPSMQLRC